jgi:adenylate kinase family enzyme
VAAAPEWDASQYRRPVLADRTAQPDHGVVGPLGGARRILLYGVTGSGKTRAAARISAATGLPWTAADDLAWEPGWVQVDEEEQRRRFAEVSAGDSWVLDSAYGAWSDLVLGQADLVVALDYPRWLSLQRLLRRTVVRLLTRRQVCNGNTESLRSVVGSDSILRWHFRSFRSKHERIVAWEADPRMPRVARFTRPRDLDRWIESLRPPHSIEKEQPR